MIKKFGFLIILIAATTYTFAQNSNQASSREQKKQDRQKRLNELMKQYEEGALIYAKQSAFGFKLNTDGWAAFYEHGKYKTITKTNLWWVEFGERKSTKEEKVTTGQDIGGGLFLVGSPYIFGKQNNFYSLRAGFGQQLLIGGKGNKNGVAVSGIYGAGISLGYLKPYYVTVQDADGTKDIKYNDSTRDEFLDPAIISGATGFTKGFGEGKVVPGAFGRVALRFDYGRYNEFLSALEIGVTADYYSKEMPIMVDNPAKKFFFNGYIAIEFGRRK